MSRIDAGKEFSTVVHAPKRVQICDGALQGLTGTLILNGEQEKVLLRLDCLGPGVLIRINKRLVISVNQRVG